MLSKGPFAKHGREEEIRLRMAEPRAQILLSQQSHRDPAKRIGKDDSHGFLFGQP